MEGVWDGMYTSRSHRGRLDAVKAESTQFIQVLECRASKIRYTAASLQNIPHRSPEYIYTPAVLAVVFGIEPIPDSAIDILLAVPAQKQKNRKNV